MQRGRPVPFDTRRFAVGDGHRLHIEQYGRPDGLPAVVLHGGPGSGSSPAMTRPFDGRRWRVVLFDQRGAGRSTPRGALADNDTPALIDDIERVRNALGIERWLVMGGSWGATLGALYAARHTSAVSGLLLRGLFLARCDDLRWFFGGAAASQPLDWARFASIAPPGTRDLRAWLAERTTSARGWTRIARAWLRWEHALAGAPRTAEPDAATLRALAAKYRLQAHYIGHGFWLAPGAVLRALARLRGTPILLLHGGADLVCPPESARLALKAQPRAALRIIDGVGHDPYAPPMLAAARDALRCFARHDDFTPRQATR